MDESHSVATVNATPGVAAPTLPALMTAIDRVRYTANSPTRHAPRYSPRPAIQGFEAGQLTTSASTSSPTRDVGQYTPLPLDLLEIPRIGLASQVRLVGRGATPDGPYVGWMFGSAAPGSAGNTVVLGHLNGKSAVFGRLSEVQSGDEVRLSAGDQLYVYIVDGEQTVPDTAVDVLGTTPGPISTLTLFTCAGNWDSVERAYDQRLVVTARLVGMGRVAS